MIALKKLTMVSACLFILVGCGTSTSANKGSSSKDAAPSFTLKDTKGNIHRLSDYKGKKLYIKMWASWCPICLSGLDELNKLKDENKSYDVITIAAPNYKNEKNNEDFTSWFTSLGYKNIQVLLDDDGKYMQKIGVRGYPTSIFIDSKGDLKKIQPGHVNNDDIDKIMNDLK